jgi:hypothetical protein
MLTGTAWPADQQSVPPATAETVRAAEVVLSELG